MHAVHGRIIELLYDDDTFLHAFSYGGARLLNLSPRRHTPGCALYIVHTLADWHCEQCIRFAHRVTFADAVYRHTPHPIVRRVDLMRVRSRVRWIQCRFVRAIVH